MRTVAFVGQALPRTDPGRPFGRTQLYKWLAQVDIGDDIISQSFHFSALVNYFPGLKGRSHRLPSPAEITKERPRLRNFLLEVNPDILVPVGKLSIQEALNLESVNLKDVIGKSFVLNPYTNALPKEIIVIPFPHPSGASSWYFQPENQALLQKALQLLKTELSK